MAAVDPLSGKHPDIHAERVLVLDFGSQYTQLIARRVRGAGVYCEIYAWDVPDEAVREFDPRGIILSGGPESAIGDDTGTPRAPQVVFELGVPVLGICYGMQTMAEQLGGDVINDGHSEFGYARVSAVSDSNLLGEARDNDEVGDALLDVWMSHGDRVDTLPKGFKPIASTDSAPLAGMEDVDRRFYGIQFHPEVTHTKQGKYILARFLNKICGISGEWKPRHIIADCIARVTRQVGDNKVLLGLSGGVDSSVVAAMLHKAIGDRLTCVFVDHGLLRLNEGDQVMEAFADRQGIRVIRVNAEQRFMDALAGVTDPEQKRKVIGAQFIEVFEEEAAKLDGVRFLAQGTIYPDVIESAGTKTGKAHVIKSHHNVGGLPEHMNMELVEPLRELFKDEVRKIGVELGLPHKMLYRHPFPGPGLGVRILGEVKKEYADLLRLADAIYIEELCEHDLYDKTSQAFAVFLPVKSVGVAGDGRLYDYVIALRAVETVDFMTAHWAHLPYEFLDLVSRRIINEIRGISRVVYDISGKPPATIEWE